MSPSSLLLFGRDRPFGIEIAAAFMTRGNLHADRTGTEPIDILVINRPVTASSLRFDAVTDVDFEAAMTDMVYDIVDIVQASLPRLASGSRVVLVGSRGFLGAWGGVHLMAASAALAGLARTMALELAERGIAVNLVAAGLIGTPWDTPTARRQVAATVCMLAEPETGLVGETIIVDGGRSLRMSESRNQ